MRMDKFAFGRAGVCYTVNDLNIGGPATGTCPPPPPPDPPPYTRTDPPIATGNDKFLGAAWSPGTASLNFANYWNQVTPENGGKWGTVEGTRDVMNWAQADASYALAKANGFKFKWHTFVWGNQQPAWIESLSTAEQLEEIRGVVCGRRRALSRYRPDRSRQRAAARSAAGRRRTAITSRRSVATASPAGTGSSPSFQLARQYFPNAELMLNDYSITNDGNATTNYLTIINLLKDRGLIDAIGDQAHAFSTTEAAPMNNHKANLNAPRGDRAAYLRHRARHRRRARGRGQRPGAAWRTSSASSRRSGNIPAVKGVTIWGYVRGFHWRNAQGDWLLYPNGGERPALQWLIRYVGNKPAVVNSQTLTVSESATDPLYAAARTHLEQNGFPVTSTSLRTAYLLLKYPETFIDTNGVTWTGGIHQYDGTNAQVIAFETRYGSQQMAADRPWAPWSPRMRTSGRCSRAGRSTRIRAAISSIDPATGS